MRNKPTLSAKEQGGQTRGQGQQQIIKIIYRKRFCESGYEANYEGRAPAPADQKACEGGRDETGKGAFEALARHKRRADASHESAGESGGAVGEGEDVHGHGRGFWRKEKQGQKRAESQGNGPQDKAAFFAFPDNCAGDGRDERRGKAQETHAFSAEIKKYAPQEKEGSTGTIHCRKRRNQRNKDVKAFSGKFRL